MIETARMAFEEVLLPAITLIWDLIVQKLVPAIVDLNTWLGATIIKAIDNAKAAFAALKEKLDPVLTVIKDITSWIGDELQPAFDSFKTFIGGISFANPFDGLLDTIQGIISKIGDAIAKLRELLGLTGDASRQSNASILAGDTLAASMFRVAAKVGAQEPAQWFQPV